MSRCRTHRAPTRRIVGATVAVVSEVPIRDESIRLGQFLKLANLIDSGADAKAVIADGQVSVNGDVETRRGRQLRAGDVVEFAGRTARVG
ncbi:MAG: RNA-binding S4 domain-containing protein [Mycobacterium sp.]|nr:RNA-binding S4 domain-containing protein [Mycobacterium sp.]